jgi:MFS family permease
LKAATTSEWRRYGPMLVPSLAGVTLAAVHGYSLGVMMAPLEAEYGWTRAQISAGPLVASTIALFAAPLGGLGVDRFGPRRIAIIGVVLFCSALAFASTAGPDIASWWLRWALLGIANMFIMPVVWTAAINSVFDVNRGKALALALCGTGLGAAIVPPFANALVEAGGWRHAYVTLAWLSALIVLPLILLLFRSRLDQRGGRGRAGSEAGEALSGLSAREGFASPSFLKLATAIFIFGVSTIALTTNAVPVLRAKGFDAGDAAGLAGLIGLGSLCGRLFGGILLDYFDARKVAAASVTVPVLTAVLLIALPGMAGPAMAGCFMLGLALGTEVDACAYLASRHFGMRSFGSLFGAINGLLIFGSGMAPVVANFVYDMTKSYDPALWALMPMCLASGMLFLSLGRYPDFPADSSAGK